MCQTDPMLYYTLGLIKHKQLKYDEAIENYQLAAQKSAYPYLPAWRAIVRFHVGRKKYQQGLKDLTTLAILLEKDSPYLTNDEKDSCANWMGRMVGFLEGPASKTLASQHQTKSSIQDIENRLTASRLESYQAGKQLSLNQYHGLSGEIDTKQKEAQGKKLLQQRENEIAKERLKQEKKQLIKDAKDLQKKATNQVQALDRQIAPHVQRYEKLAAQMGLISIAMVQLQSETANLQEQYEQVKNDSNQKLANIYLQRIAASQRQLFSNTQAYNNYNLQAIKAKKSADLLYQKRQAVISAFQQQTGKALMQSNSIDKSMNKMRAKDKKLSKEASGSKATKVLSAKRKRGSVDTYARFDLEEEKDKLVIRLNQILEHSKSSQSENSSP